MASLEVGNKNTTISYLNMVKSGTKYRSTEHDDRCEIKQEFGNSPWLSKQSDYYIAISRFCVPLSGLPIIAAMRDAIQVYEFPNNWGQPGGAFNELLHVDWEALMDVDNAFAMGEPRLDRAGYLVESIDLPACDTVYQFQRVIRDKLASVQVQFANDVNIGTNHSLSDLIKVVLGPEYKWTVMLNCSSGNTMFWVKFSAAFFKLMQFRENSAANPQNYQRDLMQRRFVPVSLADASDVLQIPQYNDAGGNVVAAQTFAIWDAYNSCADSISRIRKIVFTSDAQVKSEANTESSYRRFLVDFIIENPTNISYAIPTKYAYPSVNQDSTSITETLPCNRVYTCDNPSGGRLQELISNGPMYEMTIKAFAQCWNFETDRMEQIAIPLHAGNTFSVKLVFISRHEDNYKPDRHHV